MASLRQICDALGRTGFYARFARFYVATRFALRAGLRREEGF
jgi:hypothetical protein